MEANIYKQ